MIAFQIEVDGRPTVLAGAKDWSILALHVTASRQVGGGRSDEVQLSVGGLSEDDQNGVSHHLRWKEQDLQIGTKVVVTVVETNVSDHPAKRYRSDAEIQENPFTDEETRELRWKDYQALKAEFEVSSPDQS